ncbi:MAG: type I restriction enzyme HsdR N-terminal domain-containing protein [Chlamydiales bacterium]
MASSIFPNKLFDPIRKCWVKETPEEVVRQLLLQKMVRDLHYPLLMIGVEKELAKLPHLQLQGNIPKRRADILVFAKHIHAEYPIFPLVLIECKAVKLTPRIAAQVVGYNAVVQAPFLVLANREEILTGHFDETAGHFRFEPGLKSYSTLLDLLYTHSTSRLGLRLCQSPNLEVEWL